MKRTFLKAALSTTALLSLGACGIPEFMDPQPVAPEPAPQVAAFVAPEPVSAPPEIRTETRTPAQIQRDAYLANRGGDDGDEDGGWGG
ncbi:MAG: hypothetical protein AAF871_02495 [Pseudomonadota bacterium]